MISPMAGTIFEKSTTSLRLWFYAMYLMSSTRCGISAKQIQRETGVTYKTAWRMFKQIRSLLSEPDMQLEGSAVEIDETYVGGKRSNKHGTRGMRGRASEGDDKTPVFGMVERGGRVIACVTPNVKSETVYPIIEERIMPESMIFTDEYSVYDRLASPAEWIPASPHQSLRKSVCHGRRSHADHRKILEPSKARHRWGVSFCEPEVFADLLG